MWVRFGRWLEVGVHFGRQHACFDALDRYLVHASLRFGTSEWNYGPDRLRGPLNTALASLPSPRIDLHPDPEPLRWGVRKIVSASNHPAVDQTPTF
jgi:hypothetical protein